MEQVEVYIVQCPFCRSELRFACTPDGVLVGACVKCHQAVDLVDFQYDLIRTIKNIKKSKHN
jgi:hypothetical protein